MACRKFVNGILTRLMPNNVLYKYAVHQQFGCLQINAGMTSSVEMSQKSDYDIGPKPKVLAGSPNECRTFGRSLAKCCLLR